LTAAALMHNVLEALDAIASLLALLLRRALASIEILLRLRA
jgi:hypothetical protein